MKSVFQDEVFWVVTSCGVVSEDHAASIFNVTSRIVLRYFIWRQISDKFATFSLQFLGKWKIVTKETSKKLCGDL